MTRFSECSAEPPQLLGALAEVDRLCERRALELANRGRYLASPNPLVGAVIVHTSASNMRIIGEGWHSMYGQAHAEINAIEDCKRRYGAEADALLAGSTLYVNLEPCNHSGKTPPCTQAVLAAGITRVVFSMLDPHPKVRGSGIARLQAEGVQMEPGQFAQEAALLNAGYLSHIRRSRPWVIVKMAASMDGKIGMANSTVRISGARSMADVQSLRARCGALLAGSGTVLVDDPRLDLRIGEMVDTDRQWLFQDGEQLRTPALTRFILDRRLKLTADMRLFKAQDTQTVIFYSGNSDHDSAFVRNKLQMWERLGVAAYAVPEQDEKLDLQAVLEVMHSRGCYQVMTECGAELAGSLLKQSLADEIVLYKSPMMLGVNGLPLWQISDQMQISQTGFHLQGVAVFEEDVCLNYVSKASMQALMATGQE
ncbi:MAG: bifunctional diaminohydroxyphosphoribosylaminopyrimidine deaminase/5-amino-6-(5-phosphoribosylamino)uracil reductase RibD [Gammaproteobacteria bacterium]